MPRTPAGRRARPLALVVALALVAAAACSDDDAEPARDDDATATTTATNDGRTDSSDGTGPAFVAEGTLPFSDDVVREAIAFVEAEAGRPFVEPPRIVAQSDEEYEAGAAGLLEEDLDELRDDIDAMARYYQALAGSELGPDVLLDAVLELFSDSETILGYYLPEDDALFLPVSAGDNAELRATLVHELVHALDDQYVDLDELSDDASSEENEDSEQGTVLDLIVEGRASAVEERWREEQGDDGAAAEPFELPDALLAVPPMLVTEIGLPYEFGLAAIDARGGAAATWPLLEDSRPATVDALLFDPAGADPVEVAADLGAAAGEELHRGSFGVVDIFAVLAGQTLEPEGDLVAAASEAAVGWAGGEYVVTGDATESCVVIALAADSGRDLSELEDAFGSWASADEGRTVTSDGDAVQVTACAPFRS